MIDFHQLIEYDEWANQRVFAAIKKMGKEGPPTEIKKLFAHVLAAQVVWMDRMNGKVSRMEIWPEHLFPEIEKRLSENPGKLKQLISKQGQVVSYKNSQGDNFQNKVEEILMHLIIHGQHHRAQIAKLLRQAGTEPPVTDFIFFLRTLHN